MRLKLTNLTNFHKIRKLCFKQIKTHKSILCLCLDVTMKSSMKRL